MVHLVGNFSRTVTGEAFQLLERKKAIESQRREGRAEASMHNNIEFIPLDNPNFMGDTRVGRDEGNNSDLGQAVSDFYRKNFVKVNG